MITQPLIGLGPLWLKAQAESLSNDIAATDIRTATQDARLHGAEVFIRTLKAQRFFQIASSSLAVLDKQRQDAIALQQQGKLADADIIRFDFALSDGNTLLMQAKSSMTTAVYALIETLGLERSIRSIKLQANDSKSWKSRAEALPSLEQLLVDAEKARTDTQAASMRTAAAAYAKRATDYDYAPSLNAFARFERDFQAKDLSMPVLGQNRRVGYAKEDIRDKLSYGLTASWTIWDWGTRRHRSAEFAATVEKAKTQEEMVQSRAHIEVVQAYMELRYAIEALASSAASERLGQEVYRSIALKFNNGLSTTTDMLAAERDQARAQLAHANAQGDADLAWLKLQKVIGENPTFH